MPRSMRLERRLLLLITAIFVAATGLAGTSNVAMRALSGILMVFLLPGYLLTWLLWPDRDQISDVRRLSLIVPGSMLLASCALLLLSYSCGYQPERASRAVAVLNVALAICTWLRCEAPSGDEESPQDWHRAFGLTGHIHAFHRWHALSGLAAVVLLGSVAYALLMPRQTFSYTEFYLLTEDGHLPNPAGGLGSLGPIRCVIQNHEGQTMDYQLLLLAITPGGKSELRSETITLATGSVVQAAVDLSDAPLDAREFLWLLIVPGQPEPTHSLRLVRY